MAKIKLHNLEGKEAGVLEVSDKVFGLERNDDLVHQVFVAISANQRQVLADTKNRGERAGSGVKPWRQKGTGRARVGSVRTPVWRKGGVVFGPTSDRNFKKKVNKKMNTKAIATVLSAKLRDNEIIALENFDFKDRKTKEVVKAVSNLKIKGRTLMVFAEKEKELRTASRNIEKISNILVSQLNVLDMLSNKNILLSKDSIEYLNKKYTA